MFHGRSRVFWRLWVIRVISRSAPSFSCVTFVIVTIISSLCLALPSPTYTTGYQTTLQSPTNFTRTTFNERSTAVFLRDKLRTKLAENLDTSSTGWNTQRCPATCRCSLTRSTDDYIQQYLNKDDQDSSTTPQTEKMDSSKYSTADSQKGGLKREEGGDSALPHQRRITRCNGTGSSNIPDFSTDSPDNSLPRDTESLHVSGYRVPTTRNAERVAIATLVKDLISLKELTITDCRLKSLQFLYGDDDDDDDDGDIDVIKGRSRAGGDSEWGRVGGWEDREELWGELLLLNLSRNELGTLYNRSFGAARRLRVVDLSSNVLETIQLDAFHGLIDVRYLDLSYNRLTLSPTNLLSSSPITSPTPSFLCRLPLLERLSLKANNIRVLFPASFRCARRLKHLDLDLNRIKQVHPTAFVGSTALRLLSLADNEMTGVRGRWGTGVEVGGVVGVLAGWVLESLWELEELGLSGNAAESIGSGAFVNCRAKILRLNRLSKLLLIDGGAFVNATRLIRVEISSAPRLQYIDPDAYRGVPLLRELILRDTGLESLDSGLLESLPSLTLLDAIGSPLKCDCVIGWMLTNQTRRETLGSSRNENNLGRRFVKTAGTCKTPSAASGLSLSDPVLLHLVTVTSPCGPRVLPLFPFQEEIDELDTLELQCRAVGQPRPSTSWVPPPSPDRLHNNVEVSNTTLFIGLATWRHQGSYTCTAWSPSQPLNDSFLSPLGEGVSDRRTYRLRVRVSESSLLVLRMTSSSVTVTWRGLKQTTSRDYNITYHPSRDEEQDELANGGTDLNDQSGVSSSLIPPSLPSPHPRPRLYIPTARTGVIDIKHYMREQTINDLSPDTDYTLCLIASTTLTRSVAAPQPPSLPSDPPNSSLISSLLPPTTTTLASSSSFINPSSQTEYPYSSSSSSSSSSPFSPTLSSVPSPSTSSSASTFRLSPSSENSTPSSSLSFSSSSSLPFTPHYYRAVLNCTIIHTPPSDSFLARPGRQNLFSRDVIAILLAIVVIVGCVITALTCCARRYDERRMRQYHDDVIQTDHVSQMFLAGMDSLSNAASETYENRAAVTSSPASSPSSSSLVALGSGGAGEGRGGGEETWGEGGGDAALFNDDDLEEIFRTASMNIDIKKSSSSSSCR